MVWQMYSQGFRCLFWQLSPSADQEMSNQEAVGINNPSYPAIFHTGSFLSIIEVHLSGPFHYKQCTRISMLGCPGLCHNSSPTDSQKSFLACCSWYRLQPVLPNEEILLLFLVYQADVKGLSDVTVYSYLYNASALFISASFLIHWPIRWPILGYAKEYGLHIYTMGQPR